MPPGQKDHLGLRILISTVLVLLFLAVGVGAFVGLLSLRKDPERGNRAPPRTVVRVERIDRGEYVEHIRAYGRARALRAAEISAEVPGVIVWISPELQAGSAVDAKEELIRLDRRDGETAVAAAKARLEQAGAAKDGLDVTLASTRRRLELAKEDLIAAERELTRVRDLTDKEVLTRSDLDRQRITKSLTEKEVISLESQRDSLLKDLARAEAEVSAAESALTRAKNDLDRTTIRAPFAGRVEARRVSIGTRVAPGGVLFTLVDLSRVEVPVAIGASRYGEVVPGSPASIRLRDDGETLWEGEVRRISPVVDDQDRTFSAYLVVEGTPLENPVPPGTFVLADIQGRRFTDVMPVPRVAFVGPRVYVAEGSGLEEVPVHAREPKVLRMLPSTALVVGGIEPGDRVVVTNLEQIADGSRVRVTSEVTEE
jgi:RND family efflux transporter MFP subunit